MSEESEDVHPYRGLPLSKLKSQPNTSTLDGNEFASSIKQVRIPEYNITSMVLNRQQGLCPYDGFSSDNKCNLATRYLPNEMLTLESCGLQAYCGIYSKDGDYFVTASQHSKNSQIRLYKSNKNTYKLIKTTSVRDRIWGAIDVAFTPDQQHFVYPSTPENVQICSIQGDSIKTLRLVEKSIGRPSRVKRVIVSSDGRDIIGGASDGCIYVYDRQRNNKTLTIKAHRYFINTVAFADESSDIIYSGGNDGLIKVWDRRILNESYPNPVGLLAGHSKCVMHIDSKGDGRHLISNSSDQSIKLWDARVFSGQHAAQKLKAGHLDIRCYYHGEGVTKLFYEPKRKLDGDTSIMTYKGHDVNLGLVRSRFSPTATTGQRYIYTGCGLGRVILFDVLTGKIERELVGHSDCVCDVAWHPYKNEIISSGLNGVVGRWIYKGTEPSRSDRNGNVKGPIRL